MKCPPKVLCLTFGGHFIMTKGSIYFLSFLQRYRFYLFGTVFQTKFLIFFVQPFHKLKRRFRIQQTGGYQGIL